MEENTSGKYFKKHDYIKLYAENFSEFISLEKVSAKRITFQMNLIISFLIFCIFILPVNAGPTLKIPGYINGIGYREPDLQVPKTQYFISEIPQGIPSASFSGGTNIFIKSFDLYDDPQTNQIMLHSYDLGIEFQAPNLSEDDTFNSHPMLGFLTYRLPSISTLLGLPDSDLYKYQYMKFNLRIITIDKDLGGPKKCTCIQSNLCDIQFQRYYTPVFYQLQPPVVYYESITSVIFDPKSTTNLNIDLPQESKPFTYTKIGGFQIYFSNYVDETTIFQGYTVNSAMGQVGQIQPNQSLPVSFLWEDGYSSIANVQATFCSYDNSTCYMSKTVPVIFDLSSNVGYISGGQNLSIRGFGFMSGNISVTVAGLPCNVSFYTNTVINCQVSPSNSISNLNGTFIGSNGIKRTKYNGTSTNTVNFNNLKLNNPSNLTVSQMLKLSFETPLNEGFYYGSVMQAWFNPPVTARYRFYMSCDDQCILKLGSIPNSITNLTQVLSVLQWSEFRNFWKTNDNQKRISEWVNLTQGQQYFIEANHIQYIGGDHLSVAVEIEQSQILGHLHSMKEIQQLVIQPTLQFDQISITIVNPDSGTYKLIFKSPSTGALTQTVEIPAKANIQQLRSAIRSYYSLTFSSDVSVNLQMLDQNMNPTQNSSNATTYVYNISMTRLIKGQSAQNIIVSKVSTQSTISVNKVQQSSTPLEGSFRVQCIDPQGNQYLSQQISYKDYYTTIQYKIMIGCYYLYDKIQVFDGSTVGYYENGRNFSVRFVGLNQQPGYLNIISDTLDPLTGNNIVISNYTVQNYSSNLFYEPIPYEMLNTFENSQQVTVNVNGLSAPCHNLTCNFSYIQTVGQVQSFSFNPSTSLLILNGIDLPTNISLIQEIDFALTQCLLDSTAVLSSTNIQCYLQQNATCGSFTPTLISSLGIIPNSQSINLMTIPCTLQSVFPNQYLNIIGGDNITFVGQFLPTNLTTSTISISFGDQQQTQCIPVQTSYGYLSCVTNNFDQSVSLGQTYSVLVQINGYTIQNSLSIFLNNYTTLGNKLIPNSVSPVLKQKLTLQLQQNFLYTLVKSDFKAMILNSTNSSIFSYLNIISVDDSAKTLTFMYGGAWSGQYNIGLRHQYYGLINTKGLYLTVGSNITSISPQVGSIFGGTLLTIQGTNYGTQTTDNPIQISYNGGVGSTDCFVQTTNATTITCLLDNSISNTDGQKATVVVFLKLSEESVCLLSNGCEFTFTQDVPIISSLSLNFDTTSLQYQIAVNGFNFSGDTTSVFLNSEGLIQPALSVSQNQAVFLVQNVSGEYGQIDQMNLYFPIGTPQNHSIIAQNYSMVPQLVSITPNNGSIAGSIIVANIQGVGTSTKNLSLVDQTGFSICQSLNISQYGQIVCQTFAKTISTQQIRVFYNSSYYSCSNPNTTACQYQQLTTDYYPLVSSLSSNNPTITLNGQNFITQGSTASVQLAGVFADQVTIISSTQIQATWNMGIPPLISSLAPNLSFNITQSQVVHFANVFANISNLIQVSQSSQRLQCSFAGGCLYQISSPGLSSLLSQNQNKNYISVCQNMCQYQKQSSNSTVASCILPSISTSYSNSEFMIQQAQNLNSGVYFGTGNGYQLAFDGMNTNMNNDTQANCIVGMQFRQGYIAILNQVKFFLSVSDTSKYRNGNLIFQGSMDNITYTNIYTVDNNVHGGWNYKVWNSTLQNGPKYRFYRFFGKASGSCLINEIVFTGVETVNDTNTQYSCTPQLYVNGQLSSQNLEEVIYDGQLTPLLTSITPRYGRVEGGENISFSGSGFSSSISDYSIIIDGINCSVYQANSTLVQCTTGKRPGLVKSSLSINVANKGLVSLQNLIFHYVSYWSSDSTWGGEFQPMKGDSVNIPPGLNLFVDVDSTPVLNLVLVQGSLIFAPHSDPNHHRSFDARYVFVNGGYMEVGTELYPYTSRLTITMHGALEDPYIPIYGNKCIGLRYATLEMHGVPRQPTWTVLQQTAYQNQSQITLNQAVDWQVGEQIVIASTAFDMKQAETFYIISVDNSNINNPVLTLNSPLVFTHFAKTENYGGVDFDIRAEVGLLTRNVVYRGDPETSSANQYGATIFMHSPGDDSVIGKIANIELVDVGQAFKAGRYPIHMHMVGNVMQSYVKGNSIHKSNNRAITIHGVNYLTVQDNVAYNIKGHSIFIEDAIERRNFFKNNLVINTYRSWSLLNTDTTPANFWITFPDNDFIGNHAAGSQNYGFWFDSQQHSTGPSASTDVCPQKSQVGLFINNTAHSAGRYGLRVFHAMNPFTYPCMPIVYDSKYTLNNKSSPFWQNPPLETIFDNFTGWKCGRCAAIGELMGYVQWNNFKVSDNLVAGIEISNSDQVGFDNMTRVFNATIVGRTNNSEYLMFEAAQVEVVRGMITPRTENFTVDYAKFYYFDFFGSAALGGCSHCSHQGVTDSGARTVTFNNTYFDTTVTQKIKQQYPFRHIYYDLDGSLTGKGPNTYYTFNWTHNLQPECEYLSLMDGIVCDNSVQIRRLAWWNYLPFTFFGQQINILKWDDDIISQVNLTEYLLNISNYAVVPFKEKMRPEKSWAIPFVTGHKYKISWGYTGIDFDQMEVDLSERWQNDDKNIMIMTNFSLVRAAINVTIDGKTQIQNNTLPSFDLNDPNLYNGQNLVMNDSSLNQNLPQSIRQQLIQVFNGKNMTGQKEQKIMWLPQKCIGSCDQVQVIQQQPLGNVTYWSNPSSWKNRNNTLPKENDTVVIESGWNMILDINTPILKKITIIGRLTFLNTTNIKLTSYLVLVYGGELFIGSQDAPYTYNAQIELLGNRYSEPIAFDNSADGGSKILANVGTIQMYGIQRKQYLFRLQQPAIYGSNQIFIDQGLDLKNGDQIALLPTSFDPTASDQVFVSSYNNLTGLVILNSSLLHYHWGAPNSTAQKYNGLDIRGEVVLLSRNIKIYGSDNSGWGGQVVTSSTIDANLNQLNGATIMDSVEIFNCSQANLFNAALRFDSNTGTYSSITNSSIHSGYAWGIQILNSQNIFISDTIVFYFTQQGINLQTVNNITIRNSIVSNINERNLYKTTVTDKRAGINVCGFIYPDKCTNIYIQNNIVGGAAYAGYINMGQDCGDNSNLNFFNNIAHSIQGTKGGMGALFYPDPLKSHQTTCWQASSFSAYKNWMMGAYSYDQGRQVIFKNMTMIDNVLGFGASLGNSTDDVVILQFDDNFFYGESEIPDCPNENNTSDYCITTDKQAFYPGLFSRASQLLMQTVVSHLPVYKVMSDAVNTACRVILNRNKFFYFKSKTILGGKQSVIGNSKFLVDYSPIHEFYDTQFTDIEDGAMANLLSPNPAWANVDDCGNFPCTGPYNLLYSFKNTTWLGQAIDNNLIDFQIISNNPGFSPQMQNCLYKNVWNGYYCYQNTLSILIFQSLDYDKLDRSVQPVSLTQYGKQFKNVLNSFMDHGWDGFYTSHKRQSIFPALVDAPLGSIYNVTYTGNPPKNQQFRLISQISKTGMTIRIAYPDSTLYAIYLNGNIIEMNQWNPNLNQYGPIQQSFCGENRFIGLKNILEFFITGNCTLKIKPRDAVQSMVRMQWSMRAFFASGGTSTFADRMCAVLGIHASQMKVVSVYEGSLVINYNIVADPSSTTSLSQISQIQTQAFASGSVNLGAPILDATSSVSSGNSAGTTQTIIKNGVVTQNGNTAVTIIGQNSSSQNSKSTFVPLVPVVVQNQTIYRNVTQYVLNNTQNQTSSQNNIQTQQIESTTIQTVSYSWIAIPIVLGLFFIIVILVGIKWYSNMKKVKESELLAIKAAQLRQQELAKSASSKKLNGIQDSLEANLNEFQSPEKNLHAVDKQNELQQYNQQYDPNNDFAIFGIGDQTKGGIQSLKEKMNLADNVEDMSSEDENQAVPIEKTGNVSQSGSNNKSNSPENSNSSLNSQPASSQSIRQINPQSDHVSYVPSNLPENQEIYDI